MILTDYVMEKKDLINQLEELVKKEATEIDQDAVEELIRSFDDIASNEIKEVETESSEPLEKLAETDSAQPQKKEKPTEETNEDTDDHQLDNRFKELVNIYHDKQTQLEEQQKDERLQNLEEKKKLITELNELNKSEDHLGTLYKKFNEIQDKWKSIGQIPRGTYTELHDAYSREIEQFHYNARISRELRNHDHKKNYELKVKVIEDLEELLQEKSIRKLETHVKLLHVEFDQIGPVEDKDWEILKERFWTATRSIYRKINDHYDNNREKQLEHLKAKIAICEQITEINQKGIKSWKEWNDHTKTIVQLQDDWKKIGRAAYDDNEKIWRVFRKSCNTFFKNKRAFFKELKSEEEEYKKQKLELIEQVEAVKNNQDWKITTNQIIQVQKQWKKIPATFHREEQKLWTRFRAACNHFFDAKRAYFENLDGDQQKNLEKKEELLMELEGLKLSGNKGSDIQTLRTFSEKWQAAGFVPRKEMDRIQGRYRKLLDNKYGDIKLDEEEKILLPFKSKLQSWKNNPRQDELRRQEKQFIREKMDELDSEILQYESNLQLVSKSKGSNAFRQQIEKKIKQIERKKDQWILKLNLLNQPDPEEE